MTNQDDTAQGATFVHLESESSDGYYLTFDGQLTEAEISEKVSEHFAKTDDEGCVYIQHIERWCPKTGAGTQAESER